MKVRKPKAGRPVINLDGPDGNAFALLGRARDLAKQLGMDGKAISAEMHADGYSNLVAVFHKHFGEYVDLETSDDALLSLVRKT